MAPWGKQSLSRDLEGEGPSGQRQGCGGRLEEHSRQKEQHMRRPCAERTWCVRGNETRVQTREGRWDWSGCRRTRTVTAERGQGAEGTTSQGTPGAAGGRQRIGFPQEPSEGASPCSNPDFGLHVRKKINFCGFKVPITWCLLQQPQETNTVGSCSGQGRTLSRGLWAQGSRRSGPHL